MSIKDEIHHLVEQLPEGELHAARRFLAYLCAAPEEFDDEPLSAEAAEALQRAEEAMKRGEYLTLEEYERERGL